MTPKNWEIIETCLLIFMMIGFTLVGYLGNDLIEERTFSSYTGKSGNLSDYSGCANRTFEGTVNCMHSFVKSIYNYTIRPDTPKTLEDLKNNGGDCYDYAMLYVKMAQDLGFEGYYQVLDNIRWKSKHRVAIITAPDGHYCYLDQINKPYCVFLDNVAREVKK